MGLLVSIGFLWFPMACGAIHIISKAGAHEGGENPDDSESRSRNASAKSDLKVQVLNGSGVPGQAKLWSDALASIDLKVVRIDTASAPYRRSVIYYEEDSQLAAESIAAFCGAMAQPMPFESEFDLVVVIGKDLVRQPRPKGASAEGHGTTEQRPPPIIPTVPSGKATAPPVADIETSDLGGRSDGESKSVEKGTLIGAIAKGSLSSRVKGAEVELNTGASTKTDEKGLYRFKVEPGTFVVTAKDSKGKKSERTCTVVANQLNWCSIVLPD